MSFYKNTNTDIKPHIDDPEEYIPIGDLRVYNGINGDGEELHFVYQCMSKIPTDISGIGIVSCANCAMTKIYKFLNDSEIDFEQPRKFCKLCLDIERPDKTNIVFIDYKI